MGIPTPQVIDKPVLIKAKVIRQQIIQIIYGETLNIPFSSIFEQIYNLRFGIIIKVEMSDNRSSPISQVQLPLCHICNLQPIPQSVQFVPFIMLEGFLFFVSIKLALILLLCSYCYTRSAWFCPQCKREVEINHQVEGISQNLIIRIGNFMFMLSKFKFKILAAILISYLAYLFVAEQHSKPKLHIEKTWTSLASNCGYEIFLQNSFKANSMYAEYPKMGQWTLSGIYLRQQKLNHSVKKISIKMDPSQFKNPFTEDIAVIATPHTSLTNDPMQLGDIIEFKGQWQGRDGQGHLFKFIATKIQKKGTRFAPTDVKLLSVAEKFIRTHDQQLALVSKQEHEKLVNEKIKNMTNTN